MSYHLKKNSIKLLALMFILSAVFAGCKNKNERTTSSGMKYILHSEHAGPKAQKGEYVTLNLVYKTENDSVLFDSRVQGIPLRFQLVEPPFEGSMEEGLTYLAAGDSATFFVSADSMVRNVFSKMAGKGYIRPSFLKTGSFIKFDIQLIRIQSELDANMEQFKKSDERVEAERKAINHYIADHHVAVAPDSNGIYLVYDKNGKGKEAAAMKTVLLNYKGMFLDRRVFDTNDGNKPYQYMKGKTNLIRGCQEALMKMRVGDKATALIPSSMAFGESGVMNKMNGTYLIEPFTPVLFEIEVIGGE